MLYKGGFMKEDNLKEALEELRKTINYIGKYTAEEINVEIDFESTFLVKLLEDFRERIMEEIRNLIKRLDEYGYEIGKHLLGKVLYKAIKEYLNIKPILYVDDAHCIFFPNKDKDTINIITFEDYDVYESVRNDETLTKEQAVKLPTAKEKEFTEQDAANLDFSVSWEVEERLEKFLNDMEDKSNNN
jgi:hypothetical protein